MSIRIVSMKFESLCKFHKGLLRSSICLVFCITACSDVEKAPSNAVVKNEMQKGFQMSEGVLYKDGLPFNGEQDGFFLDSTLKVKRSYLAGKLEGKSTSWFVKGEIAAIRTYHKGIKIGVHEGWWPNGHRKFIHPFDDQGRYNGTLKEWYPSGQIYREFNYKNGKENGSQKVWKSDGRIKANYTIKNGERFGLMSLKYCGKVFNGTKSIE